MDKKYFGLLLKKGVYCYEHCTSFDVYNETSLPAQAAFYSKLSMGGVTDSDYAHAQRVWKKFKCGTFRDYTNLYCATDCLLLADIFENFRLVVSACCIHQSYLTQFFFCFRNLCQSIYDLDMSNFLTLPALSWNAALKYTKAKLDLITDTDMINFLDRALLGGYSAVHETYARSNPMEGEFIFSFDITACYAYCMTQFLPYTDFMWDRHIEKYTSDFILNLPDEGSYGCYLEVGYCCCCNDRRIAFKVCTESGRNYQ